MTGGFVAADEPAAVKHQVTGLFSADREEDLRAVAAKLEGIKLVSIDFAHSEAVFQYDAAKTFPGAKPEQIDERLDQRLRQASRDTFGIKPLRATPLEKLTLIELPVAGLDCKACCLAAYESIYRIEGVERATANFRDRLVTAHIDPSKTDLAKLETALKERGVQLAAP